MRGGTTFTIAVAGTFTAEPLEESLAFWARSFELPARIVFAPYNQPLQALLDRSSVLAENPGGANVILLRLEDWARFQEGMAQGTGELDALFDRNARDFCAAVKESAWRTKVQHLVVLCPGSPARAAAAVGRVEHAIGFELWRAPGIEVLTGAEIEQSGLGG